MSYAFLKSLLPYVESYEKESVGKGTENVEDFAQWLHTRMLIDRQFQGIRANEEKGLKMPHEVDLSIALIKLIYFLQRYGRHHSRKGLQDSAFNSLDEYTFIVNLINNDGLTKTELISRMVFDKTTGMELINRMIKQGLIGEKDNPDDKRSKIIYVTAKGKKELFKSFVEMGKVRKVFTGDLSKDELITLVHLLDKLERHNMHIWDTDRDADLDTLLSLQKT